MDLVIKYLNKNKIKHSVITSLIIICTIKDKKFILRKTPYLEYNISVRRKNKKAKLLDSKENVLTFIDSINEIFFHNKKGIIMNIDKLIERLEKEKSKGVNSILVSNDTFSVSKQIIKIEINKDNHKYANLIINDIYINEAIRIIKKYKNGNERITI